MLLGVGREQGEREIFVIWCLKIAKDGDICHLGKGRRYLSLGVGREQGEREISVT